MPENSLKAAISGAIANDAEPPLKKVEKAKGKPASKSVPKKTVLVGGHFPPMVLKQLKLIAVEDDTTNQALLEEALNLLFVKKGRAKIKDL